MGAILGGAGAAVAWAVASVLAARSSRAVGSTVALGGVMGFGLLIIVPLLPLAGWPSPSAATTGWLAVSGVANIGGLLLTYRALTTGPVGIVAPIVSAEGGVTALLAVLGGDPLKALQAIALVACLGGVMLVAWRTAPTAVDPEPAEQHVGRAALLAVGAAVVFGVGLYATGRAGEDVPVAWAVLPARLIGVAILTLPLALRGRLRVSRAVLPYVAGGGALEVAGFISFTAGTGVSIAIAATLASLTGAVAAGLGRMFYGEHLTVRQLAGIAVLVAAVGTLGAVA